MKVAKEFKFGAWIPCLEGKMPEDVLGFEGTKDYDVTPEVLIPHLWGNSQGGGNYYPAQRIRRKGTKTWNWYTCKSAKPLFWMIIPSIPTVASLAVYKKENSRL